MTPARVASPVSRFVPPPLPILLLLLSFPAITLSVNITALLADHPDLSAFAGLLVTSSVATELARRSSITLLAVPNSVLLHASFPSPSGGDLDIRAAASGSYLADVLRYHVLLQYLSPADLRQIPPEGTLVATLYQTTGRAAGDLGDVNITRSEDGGVSVRTPVPFFPSNATVLDLVAAVPYNLSIFTVDSLVVPYGLDLTASENRPSAEINVSEILINARDFNVAASMLEASGVTEELTQYQRGAGITVFVPTDEAFAELPKTERLQSLPAEKKAAVLRFHVLHSYYPLGSLESIVNPVQPTLATEDTGAGRFTLNISRVNGSVAIDTGVVQASITRTVYDQNPVSVFAVSRVLLPREIFRGGGNGGTATDLVTTPPPEAAAFAPGGSPEVATPAARTTSTQGQSNDAKSSARKSAASFLLHGGGILLYCSVEILHLLLV
ncbi:unnamed protein product [Spirodela intermedia]|uniref:FAS1 domain-containing protein n=1 Tax=Spirodela intermedia TaxID=51605 RepID=A0A7I8K285_SPIIN|nr:unnamed protein product [Spirodela intermedia]